MVTIKSQRSRPFTDAVKRKRRQGLRYQDLEQQSSRARSTAWFNNLVNATTPWAVNPPTRDSFSGLCRLFGVEEITLKLWIAQEWYNIEIPEWSDRVSALADQIDSLSDDRAALVAKIIAEFAGGAPQISAESYTVA